MREEKFVSASASVISGPLRFRQISIFCLRLPPFRLNDATRSFKAPVDTEDDAVAFTTRFYFWDLLLYQLCIF
jgi:hypothetical protein